MSVYYPQAAVTLRVTWEDFGDKTQNALQETYKINILARSVTVHINDYTQADTFDLEIDYKQFPFDPRAIRSCGVTIHMADVGKVFQENNSLLALKPSEANCIFQGFADEESLSFDDTKRTVRMEGRDFTSLLIDRKYLGGALDMTKTLDTVFKELLAELDQTTKITVVNKAGDLPILSTFAQDKSELANKKGVKKDETYWDVIQDLVARAGLIAYIELDKLVISSPRTIYDRSETKKFIYGSNIMNLEFKRKLGRMKTFNLAVRSFHPENKEVLTALIPEEATEAWSKETGIAAIRVKVPQATFATSPEQAESEQAQLKDAPFMSFRVPNVSSKDQLINIGEQVYEEVGRQQIEGSFTTKDMRLIYSDSSGPSVDFNILKMRNGTPVQIIVAQGDLKGMDGLLNQLSQARKTSNVELEKRTVDTIRNYLSLRGYESSVASAMAMTLSNPRLSTPFYTKAVKFTLDSSQGFSCDVDFVNFIETAPVSASSASKETLKGIANG